MAKKKLAKKIRFWMTLFIGITFAYFVWLSWSKLTDVIGNSWVVWGITGSIVLIGVITGFWSWKKITEAFVN